MHRISTTPLLLLPNKDHNHQLKSPRKDNKQRGSCPFFLLVSLSVCNSSNWTTQFFPRNPPTRKSKVAIHRFPFQLQYNWLILHKLVFVAALDGDVDDDLLADESSLCCPRKVQQPPRSLSFFLSLLQFLLVLVARAFYKQLGAQCTLNLLLYSLSPSLLILIYRH